MKRINMSLVAILLASIFLLACNFYGDIYLGANYWFWEDGNQSEIVYGSEKSAQGSFTIIDANISQFNFNDRYIIGKSNWLIKNGMDAYWIIDKQSKLMRIPL